MKIKLLILLISWLTLATSCQCEVCECEEDIPDTDDCSMYDQSIEKTIKANAQLRFVYIGRDHNIQLNTKDYDRLDYFTLDGNGQDVVEGDLIWIWASSPVIITHEANTLARITLLAGEDLHLNPGEGIVVRRRARPQWEQIDVKECRRLDS